jgi:acyl-coenzyme A synthetase/AMP-(fatty) acid ligase
MSCLLPFLQHNPQGTLAWWRGRLVSAERFLEHVAAVADDLPDKAYAINLCEDRYQFLVAFTAVALRGQVNLLPVNRARGTVCDLFADYSPAYCLTDHPSDYSDLAGVHRIGLEAAPNPATRPTPIDLASDQVVAVLFTSGSTGRPVPNPKRWGDMWLGAELIAKRLGIGPCSPLFIVATVPPQHMYGLELSILQPLRSGVSLYGGRPLFPENIRKALAEIPPPRLLVTTPAHLRALAGVDLRWPEIAGIVSATAPLSAELASRVEQRLRAPVQEIFGCTEAGTMATRRTAEDGPWVMLPGMEIHAESGRVWVTGPQLPQPVPLNDLVELLSPTEFRLVGRKTDLINIAGKRASLADLNLKLLSVKGVEDGVFVVPEEKEGACGRLAALVVAPTVSEREILEQLRVFVDPAFLPRPLVKLAALPRAETGKLPREKLLALLTAARGLQ